MILVYKQNLLHSFDLIVQYVYVLEAIAFFF